MMALNEKKKLFADYYLVSLNATDAAKKAGYSEKTAYSQGNRLLKDDEVRAYIEERQKERAEKLNLDAQWVLDKLVEVTEMAMQAKPVLKWDHSKKKMVETGEYTFDSTGANRALELIGKHLGMFKDKVEHSGEVNIKVRLPEPPGDEDDND